MKPENENPNFDLLDQAATLLREAPTPPGPPRQLVLDTFAAMQHPRRRIPPFTAILAIAAMLLAAIGGWFWFSSTGSAEIAFADVVREIAKTQTLEATQIKHHLGQARPEISKIMFKGPHVRVESDAGYVGLSDLQKGEHLRLDLSAKTASHSVYIGREMDPYAEMRHMAESAPTPLGVQTFNGRALHGFSGTVHFLGLKHVPAKVWVDPTTKLPARIEIITEKGLVTQTTVIYDNIQFDLPLDDSLFVMTVPQGYRVVEDVGVTRAQLDAMPQATPAQLAQLVIKPKWGMGTLPFSATREQIVKVLGEPTDLVANGTRMDYPALGLYLQIDNPSGIRDVVVSAAKHSQDNIRDFPGRTQEGIHIGSTRHEVEQAYGTPDRGGPVVLYYDKLGMVICVLDDSVFEIASTPVPEPASPNLASVPTADIGVSPGSALGPPPTDAQIQKLVLKPDDGVGDVKFEAKRADVIAAFGRPRQEQHSGPYLDLIYPWENLIMVFDSDGLLMGIVAGGVDLHSTTGGTLPPVQPFVLRTDKHIRVGSTRDEIVAAYGKNFIETDVHPEIRRDLHEIELFYQQFGLTFTLDKKTNRCVNLMMMPVGNPEPNPTTSP
jgi:hypothetical protein